MCAVRLQVTPAPMVRNSPNGPAVVEGTLEQSCGSCQSLARPQASLLPLSSARLVSFGRGQAPSTFPLSGEEVLNKTGEDGTFRKAVSASCKWSVESGCRRACACGHLVMVHRRCGGSWTTTDEIQQVLTPEFIHRSQFHTAPLRYD